VIVIAVKVSEREGENKKWVNVRTARERKWGGKDWE
jgi:hypothetical protein